MNESNLEEKNEQDTGQKDKDYKVALDIFEGPLDLLLYLIKKDEVDIYDIPIDRIAKQYLEYLELMRMLDISIAGEFLVMASTLIYIKSKMLLPPEERPVEEGEEEDPRLDLVKQLLEYKQYKDMAGHLQEREKLQEKIFTRHAPVEIEKTPEMFLSDVNIFDLIGAFKQALERVETVGWPDVTEESFTVKDKIRQIQDLLKNENSFSLTSLFDKMKSRTEVVVTFLALLELMRLKVIMAIQKDLFSEIIVQSTGNEAVDVNLQE